MHRNHPGITIVLLSFVFINLNLLSCSRSAPQIQNYILKLIYNEDADGIREQLSLFVLAQDEDGKEDLDSLYIINDEQQLYWTLKSTEWITVNKDGQLWVGSHRLTMVDGQPLPRGLYRLILTDLGGERAERTIGLDAPLQSRYPFPRLIINGDAFTVISFYPKNTLLCYDMEGTMTRSIPLSSLSGNLKGLGLSTATTDIALWAEDPDAQVGAITKTVSIKP
ncbi:hypothetical protein [Gracilinema caldarium]|uniref:Uncharacterized protein n=1 Tax=Gracilinema caldarium (strain ATCC 51460 / DSM 7334 / H1) TaxID=744872 RepID=F8EXP5_GRAC1|nr:hypothetical protein [Gracilinema caldarium]AEJ19626.1 hypothetical protein Spica_1482 [Gracilinema caldarium DSM 7334]